jgi:hypothetical protein
MRSPTTSSATWCPLIAGGLSCRRRAARPATTTPMEAGLSAQSGAPATADTWRGAAPAAQRFTRPARHRDREAESGLPGGDSSPHRWRAKARLGIRRVARVARVERVARLAVSWPVRAQPQFHAGTADIPEYLGRCQRRSCNHELVRGEANCKSRYQPRPMVRST